MQWDTLINGVRWYRRQFSPSEPLTYKLEVEDLPAVEAATEIDLYNWSNEYGSWMKADVWKLSYEFPATHLFWTDDLTNPAFDAAPPPAQPAVAPAAPLAPAQGGPQRHANPTLTSAAPAEYTLDGGVAWPVRMTVTDVQPHRSWIIQKVGVTKADGSGFEFWEAFPVEANQTAAANQDSFQDYARLDSGHSHVRGLMQHWSFGGEKPAGMDKKGSKHCDDYQYASDTQPAFWTANDGAQHDLDFTWSRGAFGNGVTINTVPPPVGNPIQKETVKEFSVW